MKRVALAAAYVVALLFLAGTWLIGAGGHEQAAGQGQAHFTGTPTVLGAHNIRVSSSHIHLEPGVRTWWHSHEHGQVMIVEQGRGRYQNQGESVKEFGAGDTAYAPANVMHWHGAAPDQAMTQVAVSVGQTTWGGEVRDDEYHGKVTLIRK